MSALLLGVLFLGEVIQPHHLVGMGLIGSGLVILDGRLWRVGRAALGFDAGFRRSMTLTKKPSVPWRKGVSDRVGPVGRAIRADHVAPDIGDRHLDEVRMAWPGSASTWPSFSSPSSEQVA